MGFAGPMKDLRIEIASLAKAIIGKTDGLYRDSRKRFCLSGNAFNVVGTDVSDHDGMEVTVCISTHTAWGPAEKMLKTKAQELTFDERAKAFDRMIAMREEGTEVSDALKAVYASIRAEEAAEESKTIRDIETKERKSKKRRTK
jgi:hypothetical protein